MLILTRRPGESIRINDNVEITILRVSTYQARVGINAPKEVQVHRDEVYNRIQQEKENLYENNEE